MKVSEGIENYLRRKRANGLSYKTEEFTLSEFRRHVGDPLITEVTATHVVEFLNARKVSSNTWVAKRRCLKMFFEFWTDRGNMPALSMPRSLKRDDSRISMPFVYRQSDIRRLIQTTNANHSHGLCVIGESTFRTILLTLYGTGAVPGEIFGLRRDDLDLRHSFIFLRGNRVVRARKVPLGGDLRKILACYLHSEERRRMSGHHVFVRRDGGPLKAGTITSSFARLCVLAGVNRVDGTTRLPQMRDFRQTFAVHRIASWINEGTDLNRMLPALSAYMGFARISSAQRFLKVTPERFKRELNELSPYKIKRHWRDDPELMKFLASL